MSALKEAVGKAFAWLQAPYPSGRPTCTVFSERVLHDPRVVEAVGLEDDCDSETGIFLKGTLRTIEAGFGVLLQDVESVGDDGFGARYREFVSHLPSGALVYSSISSDRERKGFRAMMFVRIPYSGDLGDMRRLSAWLEKIEQFRDRFETIWELSPYTWQRLSDRDLSVFARQEILERHEDTSSDVIYTCRIGKKTQMLPPLPARGIEGVVRGWATCIIRVADRQTIPDGTTQGFGHTSDSAYAAVSEVLLDRKEGGGAERGFTYCLAYGVCYDRENSPAMHVVRELLSDQGISARPETHLHDTLLLGSLPFSALLIDEVASGWRRWRGCAEEKIEFLHCLPQAILFQEPGES